VEEVITKKYSITKFQLFFVLIQSQIGIGLFSLPNVVQESAKGDSWISIILAGAGVQFLLIVYLFLLKRFPDDEFAQITQKILGRTLGKIINFFFYFYFIMTGSLSTILMVKLINLQLLPITPNWMISLLILSACIYLTISNLKIIARFFVLAFTLIILLLFLTLFTLLLPQEIQFILPVGNSGIKNILIGSNSALFSMVGFEALLFLYSFIIHNNKGVLKTISLANIFVTGFYTFIVFICLISFSPDQLNLIREPLIFLFRGLSFKMFARVDLIFLSFWIVPMTTTIIAYLFLASKSLRNEEKSYKKIVVINGILIFLISLIPHTDEITNLFTKYISYLNYAVIYVIPVLLLILSIIFKKHETGETA